MSLALNSDAFTNAIGLNLLGLLLAASYYDWYQRRIPNVLSLGGACCGFIIHSLSGGMDGLFFAMEGWAVGFAFLAPGYALGKTGAGDVKLLAAVGAFIGPSSALVASIATLGIGGIVALGFALLGRGDSPWRRYGAMFRCLVTTGQLLYVPPGNGEAVARTFPFAPAIAMGAIIGAWYSLAQTI